MSRYAATPLLLASANRSHGISDPLPFQFLTREKHLCENARFVDIDYHKLMVEKRNTIRHTSALNGIIPEVEFPPEDGPVLFRSKYYIGIGCDLVELSKLETTLKSENGSITDYSILCTAEVSLTYMDIPSANALLQWASKLSDGEIWHTRLIPYMLMDPRYSLLSARADFP